jgi:uncharacterized protein
MRNDTVALPWQQCEIKFATDKDGTRTFEGYASVFGNVDQVGDIVMKGAFSDTLQDRDRPVKMFYGHSPGRPIGIWKEMREDDHGLWVKGELTPGHSDANDVYASMRHGAIDALSIGYIAKESEETEAGHRVLHKVDLVEISVVNMPANRAALITDVKAAIQEATTLIECEALLRDAAGFSRKQAKAFVSLVRDCWQSDAALQLEAEINAKERRELVRANTAEIVEAIRKGGITP